MKVKKSMADLLAEYYAAYQRLYGISYQQKYGEDIKINGSWFILTSSKVQRSTLEKMTQTLIGRL